jgi:hypothetical protein
VHSALPAPLTLPDPRWRAGGLLRLGRKEEPAIGEQTGEGGCPTRLE